jgi:hypothetical protein
LREGFVTEVAPMHGSGFVESHLRRHFAIAIAPALRVFFQERGRLRFDRAET